ncbi:hypothetical protein N7490_009028 [Penicillium lividum]|nr:hypothetical protein N7490_009028 [Penicillium lividum]
MTSRSSIPRRRNHSESTDESNPSQPASSKRPRPRPTQEAESSSEEASDDGNTPDGSSEDDAADEDDTSMLPNPPKPLKAQPGFSPKGYKPGAIVRIKVTNFVTYTSAEFFPGPKLNMVIGPNGTGKSTLVCAICLGLGWGPEHLGRAKDLGEFVKHGCREATIEIELEKHPNGTRNPVISRNIKRDGNKSSFTLNGQTVSKLQVLKVAQKFAIQVDNLCQFLPQDKVAEFAALTPIALLHSTQRAAAGQDMIDRHEGLKKLRSSQKEVELSNKGDKEALANLEHRQEAQRADVERMRQRAEIQQKIDNLEFVRPFVEYKDWHRDFDKLKLKKTQIEDEYAQLQEDLKPALAVVNSKAEYLAKIGHVKEMRQKQVQQLSTLAQTSDKKIQELSNSMKDLDTKIDGERKSGQKLKEEAGVVTQNMNKLKRQQAEEVVEFNPEYYNQKLHDKRLEKREIETKAGEINTAKLPLAQKAARLERQISAEKQKLEKLSSQQGQQEGKLERASRDTLKAYQWVVKNQDKFEQEVFGPPLLTCSVTDPKYADAVESFLSRTDLTAFTTQSRNDFRTLQRALCGSLKLSDISIKTISQPLESMRPALSGDDLQRLGFDGHAKDFLQGPDPVIAMLCAENNLHRTPVSLKDITDEAYAELERGNISTWISGRHSYQVTKRREYGPGATSTRVRVMRHAQAWTSQPVDLTAKQECLNKIGQWTGEKEVVDREMEEQRGDMQRLAKESRRVKKETEDIEAEKAEKQSAYTHYRAIPDRLVALEAKHEQLMELFEKVREHVTEMRNQQDQIAIQKAEATIEYAVAVEKLSEACAELVKVQVRHLEAGSDLEAIKDRHSDLGKMLEEKRKARSEITQAVREAVNAGKRMRQIARRTSEEIKDREGGQEIMDMLAPTDYNMDQFNADLDSAKAHLELTQGGSANMIKEFEERERQITKLRDKLAGFQTRLDQIQAGIDEIRGQWEPRLDALISKISDAFSDSFQRIGCAGQVCLDKVVAENANGEPGGAEFDQWSIQIWVKFRENEDLSLLDSHRQSGGERAVSTIFYLMALQSLSASPFRVVDEINQGMDPRNERMVHGRLVDIACASTEEEIDEDGNLVGGGGGGQYFLITPKLLSGLSYKPGMRVLCIYSGQHMPEGEAINFGQAIRNMKAIVARGGRTTANHQPLASGNQVDVSA